MRILLCLTVFALVLAGTGQSAAFGGPAHRIIGELAQAQLSEGVRAEIAVLLEGEATPNLAGVSTWADELRASGDLRSESSAPWHYINFPRNDACRYVPERDCPDRACVVEALTLQAAILGDHQNPLDARREALKWVVHLVGDIHQPLHAGFGDDRGGNRYQVNYLGRGTNLHAVWDRLIFESAGLSEREYVEILRARHPPEAAHAWYAGAAATWAEESCRLIDQLELYPHRPGRLSRAYLEGMRPHAEARLQLAGVRLATLLETVLNTKPTREPLIRPAARALRATTPLAVRAVAPPHRCAQSPPIAADQPKR